MAERKGISLHIGVNYLDPSCYPMKPPHPDHPDGWVGYLESCEYDAEAMHELAVSQGFDATILRTEQATAENVTKAIAAAGEALQAGDIFLLTYAGHGGQVLDVSKDEVEDDNDRLDETWCLHDRQFLDDEQYVLYSDFDPGVRILILSDSCHSGTVSRGGPHGARGRAGAQSSSVRRMPPESVRPIYVARKKFYDDLQKNLKKVGQDDVKASIKLLSACQDTEEADGNAMNGFFTTVVLDTWQDGGFDGTYDEFHRAVSKELQEMYDLATQARGSAGDGRKPIKQTPNYYNEGQRDPEFDGQKPFSI